MQRGGGSLLFLFTAAVSLAEGGFFLLFRGTAATFTAEEWGYNVWTDWLEGAGHIFLFVALWRGKGEQWVRIALSAEAVCTIFIAFFRGWTAAIYLLCGEGRSVLFSFFPYFSDCLFRLFRIFSLCRFGEMGKMR